MIAVSGILMTSCQKENIENVERSQENETQTSVRNSEECEICPELIVNGDFSDVCDEELGHFISPGCVGGAWNNAFRSPDVINGEARIRWKGLINSNGVLEHTGEGINYNIDLHNGIDYCLSFDSKFEELNTGDIDEWQVCVYATNDLLANNSAQDIPSEYTYPTFFNTTELIECFALSNTDNNIWREYSMNFNLQLDYTQLWPVVLPKSGLTLASGYSNYGSFVYYDNFSMHCESEQLQGINFEKDTASCRFSFDPVLDLTTGITVDKYIWDFGDGSELLNTNSGATVYHDYTMDGIYTVVLYIVDEYGCCDEYSITVTCGDCKNYLCWEEFCCGENWSTNAFSCTTQFSYLDPTGQIITVDIGPYDFNNLYYQIKHTLEHHFTNTPYDVTIEATDPDTNTETRIDCNKGGQGATFGWFVISDDITILSIGGNNNVDSNGDCTGGDVEYKVDFHYNLNCL